MKHKIAVTVETNNGNKVGHIEIEKVDDGRYVVISNDFTEPGDPLFDRTNFAFCELNGEVSDLDNGKSDVSQCFGLSSKIKVGDIVFTEEEVSGVGGIEAIKKAVKHFKFTAYCPGDI